MTDDIRKRYRQVVLSKIFAGKTVAWLLILTLCGAVVSWTISYLSSFESSYQMSDSLITTGLAGLFALMFAFGATYYSSRPHLFTFRAAEVLGKKQDYLALVSSAEGQRVLQRLELSSEIIIPLLQTYVMPNLTWENFAADASKIATSMQQREINVFHCLAALLLHSNLRSEIRKLEYTEQDISFVIWWQNAADEMRKNRARWWTREQLLDFTGVGLSWASGYTPFVDQFARLPSGSPWDLPLGHESQVEALIQALARQRQSNVLVVGQPGSGRLGVVKEVATRVNTNRAHRVLNGQRVMYIHVGQLLGLAASGPQQMAIISQALTEMERAGNIIAVLDGFSSLLSGGGQTTNLVDVIMPFFSSNKVRVVVIMTPDDYHLKFKNNPELLELFEIVEVEPLTSEQTLQLLAITSEDWELHTGIYLPYKTLRAVVRTTDTILPEIPFPEKAFDVLEDALAIMQKQNISILTETQVTDIISRKIGFNVGKLESTEKSKLLNLGDFMHKRIVNQEKAVAAVARAMIRARAGVSGRKRPIGTFLFLGPTGVGKTETSKALAEAYFGSEDNLQRLDMSEFQGPEAVGRLIGTARQPSGALTSLISDHPFSVLLLDEFEKADRNVHLLFLQVFDEGHITDVRRRRFSFNHTIIIATSNAGAEFIRRNVSDVGTLPENFDQQLREHVLQKDLFRPELLNRFDGVITFTPLTREHIQKVATLMLRKLNKRLDEQHGLTVALKPELIDFLVKIGYNPEFGARPLNRAIQNTVEFAIAQKILRGDITPGQEITLHPQQLESLAQ